MIGFFEASLRYVPYALYYAPLIALCFILFTVTCLFYRIYDKLHDKLIIEHHVSSYSTVSLNLQRRVNAIEADHGS